MDRVRGVGEAAGLCAWAWSREASRVGGGRPLHAVLTTSTTDTLPTYLGTAATQGPLYSCSQLPAAVSCPHKRTEQVQAPMPGEDTQGLQRAFPNLNALCSVWAGLEELRRWKEPERRDLCSGRADTLRACHPSW